MELDTVLVDITSYLRALGFVLLELILQIGNLAGVFRRGVERGMRDGGRISALLTIPSPPGSGGVDHERSRAMRAGEDDVVGRNCYFGGRAGGRH